MKQRKKCFKKRFQKDTTQKYLKRVRIYPSFMYGRLDKWLKEMSLSGWHIVHAGLFTFIFEKGEPCVKEYFTYGLVTQEGEYSISLRYPFLEKTYGVKEKKSKINSNKAKTHSIVEIDLERINPKENAGYKELVADRNRLYLRYFIRNAFAILVPVVVWFVVSLIW